MVTMTCYENPLLTNAIGWLRYRSPQYMIQYNICNSLEHTCTCTCYQNGQQQGNCFFLLLSTLLLPSFIFFFVCSFFWPSQVRFDFHTRVFVTISFQFSFFILRISYKLYIITFFCAPSVVESSSQFYHHQLDIVYGAWAHHNSPHMLTEYRIMVNL